MRTRYVQDGCPAGWRAGGPTEALLFTGQLLLLLDHILHAFLHLQDGLVLSQPQASLVGDVVHPANTLRVLAVDTCT